LGLEAEAAKPDVCDGSSLRRTMAVHSISSAESRSLDSSATVSAGGLDEEEGVRVGDDPDSVTEGTISTRTYPSLR